MAKGEGGDGFRSPFFRVAASEGRSSQAKSEQSSAANHACLVSFRRTVGQIMAPKKRKKGMTEGERKTDGKSMGGGPLYLTNRENGYHG